MCAPTFQECIFSIPITPFSCQGHLSILPKIIPPETFIIDQKHMLLIRPHSWLFGEGSFEVKLPTIRTDEKQSRAVAERREKLERKSEEKESEKKMQTREKVGKSRFAMFFQ